MTQLNQIIAVEKGVQSKVSREFTDLHRLVQVEAPFSGIERTYQALDDADQDQLPSESTRVQETVRNVDRRVKRALTRLFDVRAIKDWANTEARADVRVDGVTLVGDVPVPYLLFLEKQLVDLRTYVGKLPVLDPAFVWVAEDAERGVFRTAPVETARTKKVPKTHVLYPHTDKHPAQVQPYSEDVRVGTWSTTKFSGALTQVEKTALLERVDKLAEAVKFAREEANQYTVDDDLGVGQDLLDYVFDGTTP